ncbi:hypothetical protein AJ80_04493 [Polytolypa hystricis UAMH7299]|uniref:Spo7-like protein n=1 Tax=Polytolypa hystricis (strain UAMH7299) TaxID=1447883 RepID=A0A2B7YAN0_POLH7|nr:hypothetical protein AJ80_04493 [Polytolypa hystricis UAMH7299]
MSKLDQIVKGAPPPGAPVPFSASSKLPTPLSPAYLQQESQHASQQVPPSTPTAATAAAPTTATISPTSPPDPLSTLPSSPPQIYLNLLILESSLRSQYLALRARRRQNTFFLLLLALWITYFFYALFLRPREDGRGVGGSVYWVVEMGEKVALMGGVVTGILIWGTGQWERGVRWPRRWLAVANRGLRTMNTKIVVIRGPWWKELLSYVAFLFPISALLGWSAGGPGSSFHYIEHQQQQQQHSPASTPSKRRLSTTSRTGASPYDNTEDSDVAGVEEDLSHGGDYIKLLLLPKSFSPAFRENWDEYRTEYWERENERRAMLRQKLKEQRRQQRQMHAKAEGGWFSRWLQLVGSSSGGGSAGNIRRSVTGGGRGSDIEKSHHHHHHHHHHAHAHNTSHKSRRPLAPVEPHQPQQGSHSRSSSRSTTPNPLSSDADEKPQTTTNQLLSAGDREHRRSRRSSSVTSTTSTSPLTTMMMSSSGEKKKSGGGSGGRNKRRSSRVPGGGGGRNGSRSASPLKQES